MPSRSWERLGSMGPLDLAEARLVAHHAVQFVGRVGQSYLARRTDDSQMSLEWDATRNLLVGEPIPTAGAEICVALDLGRLQLVIAGGTGHPLTNIVVDGKTLSETEENLRQELSVRGLDPASLVKAMPYELPPHAVANDARFAVSAMQSQLVELSRFFANAQNVITAYLAAPGPTPAIRVWPHHFDLGSSIVLDEGGGDQARSIGVGFSPGDESNAQPYFYVTPWPYPPADSLPELTTGAWHREGWIGAVLPAADLVKPGSSPAQRSVALHFLTEAVTACRKMLQNA